MSAHAHHLVNFHDDTAVLAGAVAEFLASGLAEGCPIVVVSTPERREAIASALGRLGYDRRALEAEHSARFYDARELMGRFMLGASPDAHLFGEAVTGILAGVDAADGHRLRIFADMVDVLVEEGNRDAAEELERLWNVVCESQPVTLLCAYSVGNFYRERNVGLYARIRRLHDGARHLDRTGRGPSSA